MQFVGKPFGPVLDSVFAIIGDVDQTKRIVFQSDTQATASTLTIDVGAQTASRILSVPVLAGADTIATLGLAQTFSGTNTFSNATSIIANGTISCAKNGNGGLIVSQASSTGFAEAAVKNDAGRFVGLVYAGSAFSGSIVPGAVPGETALLYTSGNYPLIIATNSLARLGISSGGLVNVTSSTAAVSATSGAFVVGDATTSATNVSIGGGLVIIGATTDASSTTVASLVSAGGAAFGKSIWCAGSAGQFINIANATGALKINSTQVVGAQITGYGIPTGNSRLSAFPGATATLAQCSAQIAQMIIDLKTHGLLGA